ncbi:N-acetylneuraminate synthase [Rhodospirillales bacterium]|nr:N-acetylneuraminate synthase [Rhodospirillales bacterium]
MSLFFIAEAGVNHNGDKDLAIQLIDVACAVGADAVKFQTFDASALAAKDAPKAAYQKETTGASETQFEMLKRLELPHNWHFELRDYCATKGIGFLSTPFDSGSLKFLVESIGMETIKVPSGEMTNGPFLLEIAKAAQKIFLSTGMSTIADIRCALGVLAFGLLRHDAQPSMQAFEDAFTSEAGQAALKENVSILQCTSAYPTPLNQANIRAISTLKDTFGLQTGFSDHTEGTIASLAAVALGAEIIEKHFTLDRALPGPDHKASLEPGELAQLISDIRDVEESLGNGEKVQQPVEANTASVVRKSLFTTRAITKGDVFSEDALVAQRPGDGVSPMKFWDQVGASAKRSYKTGEKI